MIQKLFAALLLLPVSIGAYAEAGIRFPGAFDDVRSSETGNCYGIDVLVWQLPGQQVPGLLSVEDGLCGDPPCAVLTGTIDEDKITFETATSLYGEQYSFSGQYTRHAVSGLLNGSERKTLGAGVIRP